MKRAFLEIVEFRRAHGRVPSSTTREIAERKLGARLDGILANDEKITALKPLDEFGLLDAPEAPASIEDLLDGDDLDLLGDESGLLDVSDLPVRRQVYDAGRGRSTGKGTGLRTVRAAVQDRSTQSCATGTSKLMPYPGMTHIVPGAVLRLNGVMLFIAEVGETEYKKIDRRENKRERLRCIFENGTESSMYRQSLAIRLRDAGRPGRRPHRDRRRSSADDTVSGYIYVLRSRSEDPQIAGIKTCTRSASPATRSKADQERREVADLLDGTCGGR